MASALRSLSVTAPLSIRIRLIVIVGCILTAGFLATDAISYRLSSEALRTAILHAELPSTGSLVPVAPREPDAVAGLWDGFLANLAIGSMVIFATLTTIGFTIASYQKQFETLATTDKLTGIGNRQVFDMTLRYLLKSQRRSPRHLSLLLVDLDHFKRVNDTLGHLAGDRIIHEVAAVAQRTLREADMVCRWGGQELGVLADGCPLANAVEIAEKLRQAIAACDFGQGIQLTASIGVTEYVRGDDADRILGRADAALYDAKAAGRNRVAIRRPTPTVTMASSA